MVDFTIAGAKRRSLRWRTNAWPRCRRGCRCARLGTIVTVAATPRPPMSRPHTSRGPGGDRVLILRPEDAGERGDAEENRRRGERLSSALREQLRRKSTAALRASATALRRTAAYPYRGRQLEAVDEELPRDLRSLAPSAHRSSVSGLGHRISVRSRSVGDGPSRRCSSSTNSLAS